MRRSRHALAAPLSLGLLLAFALAAAAVPAPASAATPAALPHPADTAFLQSLGVAAGGATALPAPAGFLPARPATTCTCTQELTDCRTLCTGNSCRPDFVCNTRNPCLSSCRCTHCV